MFKNQSPKVLYTLDSLNRGGIEVLALDVCRNARAGGLDLTFAATGSGLLEDDFLTSGTEFIRLHRRLPFDLRVVAGLRKIIRTRGIQIVHAHQAVEGLHAYFAALGTGAKVVLSFQGFIPDRKNRLALKFLIPRAAANVASSREFLRMLASDEKLDTRRNFHIIHNSVDWQRIKPTGKNLRRELGISDSAFVVGMVANFYCDPRKDQMTLVRAMPAVTRKFPGAVCVLVGGTENGAEEKRRACERFAAENKISKQVKFLGVRSDVPDILAALDAFVLSSIHESFGIAAVEAMFAGVPVLLTDIAPLREVSDDGKYAIIFPVGDSQNLAEKLIEIAGNENRREELAKNALEFAENNFSIEAHLRELKKLYEKILSE